MYTLLDLKHGDVYMDDVFDAHEILNLEALADKKNADKAKRDEEARKNRNGYNR